LAGPSASERAGWLDHATGDERVATFIDQCDEAARSVMKQATDKGIERAGMRQPKMDMTQYRDTILGVMFNSISD
jgi:hypothetical protein